VSFCAGRLAVAGYEEPKIEQDSEQSERLCPAVNCSWLMMMMIIFIVTFTLDRAIERSAVDCSGLMMMIMMMRTMYRKLPDPIQTDITVHAHNVCTVRRTNPRSPVKNDKISRYLISSYYRFPKVEVVSPQVVKIDQYASPIRGLIPFSELNRRDRVTKVVLSQVRCGNLYGARSPNRGIRNKHLYFGVIDR
jgi:hypothetical protein